MGEWADEAIEHYFTYEDDGYLYDPSPRPRNIYKPLWNSIPKGVKRHMLIRGKAKWAKVIGDPVWGYENTFKEWTTDVEIDEDTVERLKKEGLGDRIKDKGDGPFVRFSRKELKADGSPNKPIRIVDAKGNPWNGEKIGNGSVVNVNFAINEYKKGKFSMNILALQVWDHVPYNGGDFPVKEDDGSVSNDDWSKEVED